MTQLKFNPAILKSPLYKGGVTKADVQNNVGTRKIYKLNSNENVLGAAPEVVAAIQHYAGCVAEYPPLADGQLKQALAQVHGNGLEADHFYTASGGFEVLELIARGFISSGDEAIICSPTFGVYSRTVQMSGGKIVDVPLEPDTFRCDIEGILTAVSPKTRLVYLCNPNNPTGTIITAAEMEQLVNGLPDHVLLVADEVYHHFVDHDDYPNSIPYVLAGKNIIIVHSFSKAYGLASLRIGYGITTPEIAAYLSRIRRTFHISTLAFQATLAALAQPEHVEKTAVMVAEGKMWLYEQLDHLGIHFWPTQGNFLLLRCPIPAQEMTEQLLNHGIIVRSGDSWQLPNCIRVTIGTTEANIAFINALEAVLLESVVAI